nr:hypothetical protein [Desulfobacula sp.]
MECRAKGDRHCRFIMAPPSKIKDHIARYSKRAYIKYEHYNKIDIPEFFKRKRVEDELKSRKDQLEELVTKRTDNLSRANKELEEANIAMRVVLKQMEQKEQADKENFLTNIKHSILPCLNELSGTGLTHEQEILLARLEKTSARSPPPSSASSHPIT